MISTIMSVGRLRYPNRVVPTTSNGRFRERISDAMILAAIAVLLQMMQPAEAAVQPLQPTLSPLHVNESMFVNIGTLQGAAAMGHLAIFVNFTDVLTNLRSAKDYMLLFPENEYATYYVHDMYELERQMVDLINMFPIGSTSSESDRQKRSFGTMLLGFVGSVTGIYNSIQLYELNKEMSGVKTALNRVIQVVTEDHTKVATNAADIRKLNSTMVKLVNMYRKGAEKLDEVALGLALVGAMERVKTGTMRITDAALMAVDQHLSPFLVTIDSMKIFLARLSQKAAKKGFVLALPDVAQVYQLPASYISVEDGIRIMIHVPLTTKARNMVLYKFLDLPMFLDGVVIEVANAEAYLAVSTTGNFMTLSEQQLLACLKYNSQYFCPSLNVFRTDYSSTCLGAVYNGDTAAVSKHCLLRYSSLQPAVRRINPTVFAVATPKTTMIQIDCPGPIHHSLRALGLQKLLLPWGCSAALSGFQIASTGDLTSDGILQSRPVLWSPFSITASVDMEKVKEILKTLETVGLPPTHMRPTGLEDIKLPTTTDHSLLILVGLVILALIVVASAVAGVWIWRKFRSQLATTAQFEVEMTELKKKVSNNI